MEPRIQYAKTKDGVSIAFWTLGEGTPLVHMAPPPFSHIQLEWQGPVLRSYYERLAQKRKLVRFDCRGSGLSDRDVKDFSVDAQLLDLEAVVDRLGLERFALMAPGDAGPLSITYAARHPERVSHLILWGTTARGGYEEQPEVQALVALLEKDWRLFAEAFAFIGQGWSGEAARWRADFFQQATTPEAVRAAWRASFEVDVTGLLGQVRSPTLVVHPAPVRWARAEDARELASRVPDARLIVLEGASGAGWWEEQSTRALEQFLAEREEATAELAPSGVVTVLFTDIEGSTTLTQRLGDTKAQEVLRTHNRIVREALKAHSGFEVKHTGDGIMASFTSASRALECAIAIQRAFSQYNESNPDTPIPVRVGLNAGEPVAEEQDLFGTAVQLAARIAAKAEGEEILVSDTLRGLVAGKGFLFSDRGEVALRGFEDPVRLYEVRWGEPL